MPPQGGSAATLPSDKHGIEVMDIIRRRACSTILLALAVCSVSQAQHWYEYAPAPKEFDWQWFAPSTPYCSDEPVAQKNGYFFNAERMHMWLTTPSKTSLGNTRTATPGNEFAAVLSNVDHIYQVYAAGYDMLFGTAFTGQAQTSLLATGVAGAGLGHQFNSIDDANPETNKGWGNRFEFGWIQNGNNCGPTTGWMVSIIDGIEMNSSFQVGFDDKRLNQLAAAQGLDGIDANPVTGTGPVAPVAGIQSIPSIDGLLTTHVNFSDPFGLLLTFLPSQGAQEFGITGQIADLNGNGNIDFGAFNQANPAAGGDQLQAAVVFDQIEVFNTTELAGGEVMAIRRKRRLHNGGSAEVFFGARYLEFDDRFFVDARGGVLADMTIDNNAINRIVGPQIGFRVTNQTRRWTTTFNGRFLAGANFLEIDQNGVLGDHATTGAINGGFSPAAFGGADARNSFRESRFAPVGEFRLDTSMQVTRAIKLKVGWQAMVIGGLARASNTVDYVFPTLGILDKKEEAILNSVTLGLEMSM